MKRSLSSMPLEQGLGVVSLRLPYPAVALQSLKKTVGSTQHPRAGRRKSNVVNNEVPDGPFFEIYVASNVIMKRNPPPYV